MDAQQFINELEKNYNRVCNFLGHSTDVRVTMGIATKYTLAGQTYGGMAFQRQLEELREIAYKEKWYDTLFDFSSISTNTYRLATHILLHDNRELFLKNMLENERRLHAVGFKKSNYRSIAAVILSENVSHETIAKQLYDEMQKRHRFLTGKDDIPYAVLVSTDLNKDVVTRADTMHQYYNVLKQNGFKIGEALQALTQILSMYSVFYDDKLAQYTVQLKKELEQRAIKVKKMHYAYIGVLALTMSDTATIETVASMYKQLRGTKMLKSEGNYALSIAVQFTIQQLNELNDTVYLTVPQSIVEVLDIVDLTVDLSKFLMEGISSILSFDFPS